MTEPEKKDLPECFKVLVVEDESFQRASIVTLCESCGYKVQAVASGEECVPLIEAGGEEPSPPWDLVFCDVWLGGAINGVDILLRLRRCFDANISVIMVSASDRTHIVEQCIQEGADSFLLKPMRKQEMSAAKSFVVRRRRQSKARDSSLGIAAVERAMSNPNSGSASWPQEAAIEPTSSNSRVVGDMSHVEPRLEAIGAIRGAVSSVVSSLLDALDSLSLAAGWSPGSSAASPRPSPASTAGHSMPSLGTSPLWGAERRIVPHTTHKQKGGCESSVRGTDSRESKVVSSSPQLNIAAAPACSWCVDANNTLAPVPPSHHPSLFPWRATVPQTCWFTHVSPLAVFDCPHAMAQAPSERVPTPALLLQQEDRRLMGYRDVGGHAEGRRGRWVSGRRRAIGRRPLDGDGHSRTAG